MPKTKKSAEKKIAVKKTKVKAGLTIPVYDLSGKQKGNLELPKAIFSVEANPKLLAQYVRVYLSNQRQGTASTKTRGEVIGSTRKIYKQKGTGRARHGDIKAPIFTGGGVVGGPRPRSYSLKMNKKQTKKALFTALTLKFKENGIIGLSDEFLNIKPKTKLIVDFLKSAGLKKEKILLVLPKMQKNNLVLAARNLQNISFINMASINPFEVLRNSKVLIVEQGLQILKKRNEN